MSEPEYLTVTQAAARLGISERTLRKRIKAGEVEAEKRPLEGGGTAWQVLLSPDRIGSEPETESEANRKVSETRAGSEPEARRKFFESESLSERKQNGNAPEVSEPISETRAGSGTESTLLAHLQAENEYLKSQVDAWRLQTEAANRTAAEASAALREALKMMPKALPESTLENVQETPPNAPQSAQSTLMEQTPTTPEKAPQRGGKRPKLTAWQRVAARLLGIR